MQSEDAPGRWGDATQPFTPEAVLPAASGLVRAISWATVASTSHRMRRGEGALLAINFSLIAQQQPTLARGFAQALVSTLTLLLMYALNDLYDAPIDANNPKKDRALIAVYLDHRLACTVAILTLKVLTVALAFVTLDPLATAATAGVMVCNLLYSGLLKGMPVADVAWCGLWGGLYAAIVGAPMELLVLVALMTSVCHLFQTLDDRVSDAANGIQTTAVRSATLSRNVLVVLSLALVLALHGPLGWAWAATAVTPLVFFFAAQRAVTAWLLTKAYFGVVWLLALGIADAAG
jgi:4-hydroxybenzoate polyprenyltransferase